jgi:hypothetical protein
VRQERGFVSLFPVPAEKVGAGVGVGQVYEVEGRLRVDGGEDDVLEFVVGGKPVGAREGAEVGACQEQDR